MTSWTLVYDLVALLAMVGLRILVVVVGITLVWRALSAILRRQLGGRRTVR